MKFFTHLKPRMLLIGAVATLPLLASSIYVYYRISAAAEEAARQNILVVLRLALQPEAIVMDNMRQVLRIMSKANEMVRHDPKECSALAGRLLKTQTEFIIIGAATAAGEVFCSGKAMPGAVSVADRRWFREASQRNDFSDGELLVGRITGERSIGMGYPMLDQQGVRRAVLYAALRLDWLQRLVKQAPIAPGWVIEAHGVDGHVDARHPDPETLQGRILVDHQLARFLQTRPGETVRVLQGPDGVRRVVAIAPLASANGDIYLVVGAPPEIVFATVRSEFQGALLLSLGVALAFFALAWCLSHRGFVRFAQALNRAIGRLAAGDLSARVGVASGIAELQSITTGFDNMAAALEKLDRQHRADSADQRIAAMVFEAGVEGILITDAERRILQVNPSFCEITGYAAAEVIGRNSNLLKSGVQDGLFYQNLWAHLATHDNWQGEIVNRKKDGSLYPEWLSITKVRNSAGAVVNYIGHFSDLTQHKALDQRVQQLLNYDVLSGLPNRILFQDRVQHALAVAQRNAEGVALFCIELARFRVLSDMFGHAAGDTLLVEVGKRMQGVARAGDTVAQLAIDQFGLLMVGFDQESDLGLLAQRVLKAIGQPLQIGDNSLIVAANIGISVFSRDGDTAEDLLKAAEVALARAGDAGRNTFRFFAAGMDLDTEWRLRIETELRKALAAGQLDVHYQPQIELATGRVCGTEALMRWTHPAMGPIAPAEFIPIAEEAGLIGPLGAWVLLTACRQNKAWLDAGLASLPVAVKLSAKQIQQPDLIEMIAGVLADTGLPPGLLELELTESALIGDGFVAADIVQRIKALGVRLALEDFGAAYSSLSYLADFPFDKIKIGESFVRDITSNPTNAAIDSATIALAHSLDLVVQAVGVETDAQMSFLKNRQCEVIQGHLFSQALPAAELAALLATGRSLKVSSGDGAPKLTLLLVDDEPNILAALKRVLRPEGYQILMAESPEQAFELLAQYDVQVIVSDQRMPLMSGTEFLERTKRLYPNTVRMILSGYTDLESVTQAINRGAIYKFLTKPWDDDVLRTQIREAFRVAQGFKQA